mmetsp:Transcript_43167/g.67628  ORF Transcript_43167/g.67628 Transcript_43167/m.67628 type:complete len:86 (+) Transcript_43167:376-633(+)
MAKVAAFLAIDGQKWRDWDAGDVAALSPKEHHKGKDKGISASDLSCKELKGFTEVFREDLEELYTLLPSFPRFPSPIPQHCLGVG